MDKSVTPPCRTHCRWTGIFTTSGKICLTLILLSATIIQTCHAYDMTAVDVSNTSFYKELTRRNILVVDELHTPLEYTQHLEQRQAQSNGTEAAPTLDTPTGLPVPFDTSLGSNFTDSACPDYFTKFLADPTFQSCLPMSLLLQNSMSFFQAARSKVLLTKTLEKSCSASLAVCSPLMSQFAEELISSQNCQADYQQQNPLVMQAYAGLTAYEPLYRATCLKSNTTGDYCFVDAMEAKSAADSYPYYTAIGLQLPAGTQPECTSCLQNTMAIFAGYAVQSGQSLSQTYLGCAMQVNQQCGPTFASTQVKSVSGVQSTNGASTTHYRFSLLFVSIMFSGFLI